MRAGRFLLIPINFSSLDHFLLIMSKHVTEDIKSVAVNR